MLDKMIGEDIQVQCKLQDGLFDIEFDPGQLDQIFLTLAANARDAMPRGGTLTVETGVFVVKQELAGRFHLPPGAYVELQVTDSGVGMDEATCSHIFEPFFTTKNHGEGAGLGLATLQSIVKQDGGDIQVFSTPGTGTTVKIYLPAVSSDGKELSVSKVKSGPEAILVLEDEPMVLRFLVRALERKKYKVVACSNIDEAKAKFEELGKEIDLILTDVVLPKGSGPEFIRDLRARVPALKVLFMTGHTEHELVDPQAYEGGRGPLEKPILMEELFARVRESLDSSLE